MRDLLSVMGTHRMGEVDPKVVLDGFFCADIAELCEAYKIEIRGSTLLRS